MLSDTLNAARLITEAIRKDRIASFVIGRIVRAESEKDAHTFLLGRNSEALERAVTALLNAMDAIEHLTGDGGKNTPVEAMFTDLMNLYEMVEDRLEGHDGD